MLRTILSHTILEEHYFPFLVCKHSVGHFIKKSLYLNLYNLCLINTDVINKNKHIMINNNYDIHHMYK